MIVSMNITNKEAGEMRDDVELMLSKAKDQEELRQLLDSLKSSDVISVQVSSSFLVISSQIIVGNICCCCPKDEKDTKIPI